MDDDVLGVMHNDDVNDVENVLEGIARSTRSTSSIWAVIECIV